MHLFLSRSHFAFKQKGFIAQTYLKAALQLQGGVGTGVSCTESRLDDGSDTDAGDDESVDGEGPDNAGVLSGKNLDQ